MSTGSLAHVVKKSQASAVDCLGKVRYNKHMNTKKRTPRKDSNYVIYEAVSERGENYIGLTRKGSVTVAKAVKERWRKHLSRARNENRLWALYIYLKSGGLDMTWEHRVIAVVRGRAEAYDFERGLVKQLQPTLNDQYM